MAASASVIERLIDYVSLARTTELPPAVLVKTKHHILDTLAAMVSGAQLRPGRLALEFAALQGGGPPEAQVVASDLVLPVIPAATANGMLAHADETDDSNGPAGMHPGCSVMPAALAMGEREDASGAELIRAVALGYDIGGRINRALGRQAMRQRGHLPFSIGGTLGATAAAGCLARLTTPEQYRFLFSYGAQQASGIMTYARDTEHIEKAFVFGGMPSRNGLTAALMVQAGFTGVWDVFSGDGNFLFAFADNPDPEQAVSELGSRFEVMNTNIKKYCVGFPIQSAMEALLLLAEEHGFKATDVERIVAYLTEGGAQTVNDREMPNINLQYLFAVALLDGEVSLLAAHDVQRMHEPAVLDLRSRVTVLGDAAFDESQFPARVEVELKDGTTYRKQVDSFRGKAENPLTTDEVENKARALIQPVFGQRQTEALLEAVRDLEHLPTVRELRPLLARAS